MLRNTQLHPTWSKSSCLTSIEQSHKNSLDQAVRSPMPVKRKTCILKSFHESSQMHASIAFRSFNKVDELIQKDKNQLILAFNFVKQQEDDSEELQDLQDQSFSKMVKSDELFNKKKHDDIKQLRNLTKNPLGKEASFPQKSFENLKFAKDSLSYFDDLEKLDESQYSNQEDFDIEKELDLLKEISINEN